jgi:hypothetical protein
LNIKGQGEKVEKSSGGVKNDLSTINLQVKYQDKIPTEQ